MTSGTKNSQAQGALSGRVAVVTGASRGIGAGIARRFAKEGAALVVVARTEEPSESRMEGTIHSTVQSILDAGGSAIPMRANLANREDVVTLIDRVEAETGPVDILVNNAGINRLGHGIEEVQEKHYRLFFEIMVHAPFLLSQRVVPDMKCRGRGWILNISTAMARHPLGPPYPAWASDGSLAHAMCKAALDRLSTGLAAELHGTGIRVNSLGPSGGIMTPGAKELAYYGTPEHSVHEVPATWIEEAAVLLCSGGEDQTGGIWTDVDLLGLPNTNWIWTKEETF